MSTASILGFVNAIILIGVILGGVAKGLKFVPVSMKKKIRVLHKYAGIYLLIAPLVHAYMMLGGFRYHPGFILYGLVLLNVVLVFLAKRFKNKFLYTAHKVLPLLILVVLFGHVYLL